MDNIVDMAKNSFIANVNLLVRKLNSLIELNIKFTDESINALVRLASEDLEKLIKDLEKGDNSVLLKIVQNFEMLQKIHDSLIDLPDLTDNATKLLADIQRLANEIQSYAKFIKQISAKAKDIPNGQPAKATLNPETGEILFEIPQGRPGTAPTLGIIDCGYADSPWLFIIDGGNSSSTY